MDLCTSFMLKLSWKYQLHFNCPPPIPITDHLTLPASVLHSSSNLSWKQSLGLPVDSVDGDSGLLVKVSARVLKVMTLRCDIWYTVYLVGSHTLFLHRKHHRGGHSLSWKRVEHFVRRPLTLKDLWICPNLVHRDGLWSGEPELLCGESLLIIRSTQEAEMHSCECLVKTRRKED